MYRLEAKDVEGSISMDFRGIDAEGGTDVTGDGSGIGRPGGVILRPVVCVKDLSAEERDLLFIWRNDPVTRANSFNTDPVSRDAHDRWLNGVFEDPGLSVFLAESEGRAVGVVRAEYRDGSTELSWTVAPDERGKGVGSDMVRLAMERLEGVITARIKASNIISMRVAVKAGFSLDGEKDGVTLWRAIKAEAGPR